MFENFFGLREDPFNVNPDPRYLYQTPYTQEALACLTYAIQRRKGFVLLTGEVGTGKTTLLNKLFDWLRGEQLATAFIFNPRLDASQFLEFAMADFGINTDSQKKSQALLRLNQWLLERYRVGETAVLIVDEAQNLSLEVLEEIRLLTNLETSTEKLLQIVLSGQPELEHMLKQPQLRQLLQRIVLRCKTYPLTLEQTRGYIVERLRVAGASSGPIFTPEAVELVYRFSQGIPRLINLLCEHALITSFAETQKSISPRTITAVAHEFELDAVRPVQKLGSSGKDEYAPTREYLPER
jgi:type II secretory pathway predicted ATPase ExeA